MIELRIRKLQEQHFSPDQLDLLATRIGRSVEMLQMMIDGVAEIDDTDARHIERILEKPIGFLDNNISHLDSNEKNITDTCDAGEIASEITLSDEQMTVVQRFVSLTDEHQKLISNMILALSAK